jgi:hypothetical protein
MPCDHESDVEEVESNHGQGLPEMKLAVHNEAHAKCCGDQEEHDVANEALFGDLEGADEGHGARYDRGDEACRANQLAHGQTGGVCAEGSKSREDVGAAVAERQQRDASQTLAHAQHSGDCVEVDAKEVAGCDADGAEEHGQPERHYDKGDGFRVGHAAVVEGQVRDDAGLLVGAVGEHEGAFVLGAVDEAALDVSACVHVVVVCCTHLCILCEEVPLPQRATRTCASTMRAVVLGQRQHCHERDGEESEGKGPRRVFFAAPSLHCVQDIQIVHCHDMLLHARAV